MRLKKRSLNTERKTPPLSQSSAQSGQSRLYSAVTSSSTIRRVDSRNATPDSGLYDVYGAVVVGAGPAGITAVGNLLENRIDRILWVDHAFDGGRVNQYYREVPSNTKAKLFIEFATAVAPFRESASGSPSGDLAKEQRTSEGISGATKSDKLRDLSDKLLDLQRLDQESGCHLRYAADLLLMLTEGLKRTPGVIAQTGQVTSATLHESTATWAIDVSTEGDSPQNITSVQAQRLILCTGSSPIDPPLPYEPGGLKHLHLDTALSPTKLSELLSPLGPTTVAVIGASHSAVLVLWNLANLALTSKPNLKVKWFTRHPLRYAEYEDGFIARDNTGLKGEAAQWARNNLEPETMPDSLISGMITKITYNKGDEESAYREHLSGTSFVVQAIGYHRDPLPTLRTSSGQKIEPLFDHNEGVFHYMKQNASGSIGELAVLPGVYGAGIAFPEKVVDKKYGHEEMNVGFYKFMQAVKKWSKGWKAVAV
ncbi:hypothetical protein SLS60_003148 [Paraconiothyrium brasiliense]|uniref:FAD/NAD(P)-binding domain-containing protein n=1 Tax=Paraconiothyrium brasiliense TaxID=300254 RepID=A0ABR3RUV1_9PLEO